MAAFISRGFSGRRREPDELRARLPPGQYAESGFPVLTAGPTPHVDRAQWRFRVDGMVAQPQEWSFDEFSRLPFDTVRRDIHCVTKWAKFDPSFGGVSVDALLADAQPQGRYTMVYSFGGYTTNLEL